jgi:hypothetical protein
MRDFLGMGVTVVTILGRPRRSQAMQIRENWRLHPAGQADALRGLLAEVGGVQGSRGPGRSAL